MIDYESIARTIYARTGPTASAAKRGRNPAYPYVPVLDYGPQATGVTTRRTTQVLRRAFATRDEALAYAARMIDANITSLAAKLADRGQRALREFHGLPRELADLEALHQCEVCLLPITDDQVDDDYDRIEVRLADGTVDDVFHVHRSCHLAHRQAQAAAWAAHDRTP